MKLEKNVPLPEPRSVWPFRQMEVGYSFIVPENKVKSCRAACHAYGREHAGVKFSVRAVGDKHRCWRIA